MCALVRRNAATGDLFRGSDPAVSGLVTNLNENLGAFRVRGVDLTASYALDLGPGRLTTSFMGNVLLEREISPLQGDATVAYDCAGRINPQCQNTSPFIARPNGATSPPPVTRSIASRSAFAGAISREWITRTRTERADDGRVPPRQGQAERIQLHRPVGVDAAGQMAPGR